MKIRSVFLLLFSYCTTIAAADTRATFTLPSGVEVNIVEAPITTAHRAKFKAKGCTEKNDTPCLVPKTYVKSIFVSVSGHRYALEAADMYDAWGNRPLEVKGKIRYFGGKCFDALNCRFRGLFSDASEAFVAEWVIANGRMSRTVFSGDSDIVDLFMRHIDPPEFE